MSYEFLLISLLYPQRACLRSRMQSPRRMMLSVSSIRPHHSDKEEQPVAPHLVVSSYIPSFRKLTKRLPASVVVNDSHCPGAFTRDISSTDI